MACQKMLQVVSVKVLRKIFGFLLLSSGLFGIIVYQQLLRSSSQESYDPTEFSPFIFRNAHVETTDADQLAEKIKVFCFVTASPKLLNRALAVNATWLRRCTRSLFVTSSPLPFENTLRLDVPDDHDHLTAKTFGTFEHLYEHYLEDYDWFLKADDDVFIIMENLRVLLSHLSPQDPVYLGHHLQFHAHNGYMSGGASYILSQKALRLLGSKGIKGGMCKPNEPDEDVEMGICLESLGVLPYKSRDVYNRESFHPWPLDQTLLGANGNGVQYSLYPQIKGAECCSQLSVSFHYIDPNMMYVIEAFLYRVSVYGRQPDNRVLKQVLFKPEVEMIPHKDDKEIFYPPKFSLWKYLFGEES